MLGISPVLQRALTFTNVATLIPISAFQTPEQIRAAGREQLVTHLRRHRAVNAVKVGDQALAAAAEQDLTLPRQDTGAALAGELVTHLLQLHQRMRDADKANKAAFSDHPQAGIIRSLPGMGALAAAEFIVAVGDLSTFASPDHLAAYAGLAPVARDSGKRVANLRRPQRYNRRLRHVFHMSSLSTLRMNGPSRDYYQRKRAEGRKHQQALIALARRRVDVLWALLRDNRCFQLQPPSTTPARHHQPPRALTTAIETRPVGRCTLAPWPRASSTVCGTHGGDGSEARRVAAGAETLIASLVWWATGRQGYPCMRVRG
ncbi:transposase [Micromonospora sp. NPDC005305]|uniref:transposase n=1 Tax=Micromonospora sp. NPDC005305 TaxID=3156875 RepID=UPI0033BB8B8A